MFGRLYRVVKLLRDLAEVPSRLAAIEERIKQLESSQIDFPPYIPYIPPYYPNYPIITSPNTTGTGIMFDLGCIDGKGCDYPNPWFGINPAPCKKCGIAPEPAYTVTCMAENINQIN